MSGFLGKGSLFLDRDLTGGYIDAGNAVKFEINETAADEKERISRGLDSYGQALDSVVVPKPATISIEIDEMQAANLAIALRGLITQTTVTAGTVTAEEVTAGLDKFVPLANGDVSSVIVKDSTDTTTYVEGTDYVLNARLGWIEALSTGSISDTDVLHIDYSYGAKTYYKITGSKEAFIKTALVLDGQNQVNGKNCKVTIYEARIRPQGAVDFLANDYVKLSLGGLLITPAGKTEPYTVEYDV